MEIDLMAGSSAGPSLVMALPHIDENTALDTKSTKEKYISILDKLETHVERLRKEAAQLEEEKDQILASLDSLRHADSIKDIDENEREDLLRYADRITSRCHTVDVHVHTNRDATQEEALFQINHLIDSLVISLRADPDGTKIRCQSYMNACSSHYIHGVTDKKFESALLGCTIDDQKRVKKRLQGLLNYFDKLEREMYHN